jgi:hypothetical protein
MCFEDAGVQHLACHMLHTKYSYNFAAAAAATASKAFCVGTQLKTASPRTLLHVLLRCCDLHCCSFLHPTSKILVLLLLLLLL